MNDLIERLERSIEYMRANTTPPQPVPGTIRYSIADAIEEAVKEINASRETLPDALITINVDGKNNWVEIKTPTIEAAHKWMKAVMWMKQGGW